MIKLCDSFRKHSKANNSFNQIFYKFYAPFLAWQNFNINKKRARFVCISQSAIKKIVSHAGQLSSSKQQRFLAEEGTCVFRQINFIRWSGCVERSNPKFSRFSPEICWPWVTDGFYSVAERTAAAPNCIKPIAFYLVYSLLIWHSSRSLVRTSRHLFFNETL